VAEVNSGFQKLLHRNFDSQSTSSSEGMLLIPSAGTASFSAGSLPAV